MEKTLERVLLRLREVWIRRVAERSLLFLLWLKQHHSCENWLKNALLEGSYVGISFISHFFSLSCFLWTRFAREQTTYHAAHARTFWDPFASTIAFCSSLSSSFTRPILQVFITGWYLKPSISPHSLPTSWALHWYFELVTGSHTRKWCYSLAFL